METSSPDFGDGGVLGWLKKAFDPTAAVTGGMASPSLKGDEIRKPSAKAAPAPSPAPASTGPMSTYETPYGTVQAPSLEAAQRFIRNEKAKRAPFENDAGQMVLPSGKEVAQPNVPLKLGEGGKLEFTHADEARDLRQRYGVVGGAAASLGRDLGDFVGGGVRSFGEGAAQGGRDLVGGMWDSGGRRYGSDISPETKGAVAALATGLRFGRPGPATAPVPAAMPQASRQAIATGVEPALRQQMIDRFAKGVGIPSRGVNSAPELQNTLNNVVSGVRSIIDNKDDLQLTGTHGAKVGGRLPETVMQNAEAIDQTKDKVFRAYNDLMKKAEGTASDEPSNINKFNKQLADAVRREEIAKKNVLDYGRAIAYQGNKSPAAMQADLAMGQRAQRQLQQATADKVAAQQNISKRWVDLKPIAQELLEVGNSTPVRLHSKAASEYALDKAKQLMDQEALSPTQAQELIRQFNASLNSFYANPSFETTAKASIDAMVAAKARAALDHLIFSATGEEYGALKHAYGALSALEKQATRAALKQMNNPDAAKFVNQFFNVESAAELLRGLATMDASALGRASFIRGAQYLRNKLNSPDRAIARMYRDAEARMRPPPAMSFKEAKPPEPPKIGDRGPMGGTLTNVQSYKAPLP